ncbi:MAG: hypothetical protein WKF75_05335 [Singulisphaera sp.]
MARRFRVRGRGRRGSVLKSRYLISPEEAAERLADESGYRPGIIPVPSLARGHQGRVARLR